jgi:uncharacterized protein YjcR
MRIKTAKRIIKEVYGGGELITTVSPLGIYTAEIHGYKARSTWSRNDAIKQLAKEAIHDKQFRVEVI